MARKKTDGAWPVKVTEDVFGEENSLLAETLKEVSQADSPRVALVADMNVVQRTEDLGRKIGRYFQAHGITLVAKPVVLSGGEKIKTDNFLSTTLVANALLDAKIGANDTVIALGGGTVLDVAGYVAAQIRGGTHLLRIPTTVAAMIDASYATYAAVDSAAVKDAYRVRSTPVGVLVDPLFASTVLDGVWRAGFSEAVRFAAVHDAALMRRLAKRAPAIRARDMAALRETVEECVAARAGTDYSPFALWCAARLEPMSGYKIPHGYSVAIATCIDCAYAVKTGQMKDADQNIVGRTLADCGALDSLSHSNHLISQKENLLKGLDAWALATGSTAITLPGALGKSVVDESPDREAYAQVFDDLLLASRES